MRRLTLSVVALCAAAGWLGQGVAVADDGSGTSCHGKYDRKSGICTVVIPPPAPGDPAGPGPGAPAAPAPTGPVVTVSAPAGPPVCLESAGKVTPCTTSYGDWNSDHQCYLKAAAPQPLKTAAVWGGHTDGAISDCTALGVAPYAPETVQVWLAAATAAAPPVDFQALARQALAQLTFTQQAVSRYPAGTLRDGTPYTAVKVPTWFWADAAAWKPMSKRVYQGDAWSEVTATPSTLTMSPGDGGAAVTCAGPGTVWSEETYGPYVSSPSGCNYRYPHTSAAGPGQVVTAEFATLWTTAWTSSSGAGGALESVTTRMTSTFAVAEVQTVVVK